MGQAMLGLRSKYRRASAFAVSVVLASVLAGTSIGNAQAPLPWDSPSQSNYSDYQRPRDDAYRPNRHDDVYRPGSRDDAYRPNARDDAYRPQQYGAYDGGSGSYSQQGGGYRDDAYRPYDRGDTYVPPPPGSSQAYRNDDPGYTPYSGSGPGELYGRDYGPPSGRGYEPPPADDPYDRYDNRTYSRSEILEAGHAFFGSVSRGLASVVEYAFQKAGRPNGYILGEDAGGAFIAGLRYGEGTLYTKDAGRHKVYWQGPSIGYDFGGEGSKTMVLVYNLRHPHEIYNRFAGVQGSAYIVGGVSIQFQKHGDVVLAPIRSGVGLRLGANVGYLKYTRTPTWNPF